jgi:hypothetical protein
LRALLAFIAACAILGGSAGVAFGSEARQAQDVLTGIFEDIGDILNSLAGGPNDPRNPVTNENALRQDAQRLNEATQKASQLAAELSNLPSEIANGRGDDSHR